MRRLSVWFLLLLAACSDAGGTAGPAGPGAARAAEAGPTGPVALVLEAPGDSELTLSVEVADAPSERSTGLMGRTQMGPDEGMVFLFPGDVDGSFNMKNTLLPLSIAFFDSHGRILRLLDMDPCEADPCQPYRPGVTYRGALEVHQGYFAEHGVRPGWRVHLPEDLPEPS